MSLQFRRYHYSESDCGGAFMASNLQAPFRRYTYHSHYKVYAAHICGVSPFIRRVFFSLYRNLNVIAVSLIIRFALIGFADCIRCATSYR